MNEKETRNPKPNIGQNKKHWDLYTQKVTINKKPWKQSKQQELTKNDEKWETKLNKCLNRQRTSNTHILKRMNKAK